MLHLPFKGWKTFEGSFESRTFIYALVWTEQMQIGSKRFDAIRSNTHLSGLVWTCLKPLAQQ